MKLYVSIECFKNVILCCNIRFFKRDLLIMDSIYFILNGNSTIEIKIKFENGKITDKFDDIVEQIKKYLIEKSLIKTNEGCIMIKIVDYNKKMITESNFEDEIKIDDTFTVYHQTQVEYLEEKYKKEHQKVKELENKLEILKLQCLEKKFELMELKIKLFNNNINYLYLE